MQQDANKTNAQLLVELRDLRQKNNELEAVVSNLKETNKLFKEGEERFRAIANYSFDWQCLIGIDGSLLWTNPAVEKFTGYSDEEYMNLSGRLQQIIWDEDRDRILSHFENGVQKRQPENDVEFQLRRKDGSLNWVSVSYQPMYTETGECLGLRSSIRDISRRKLEEQALQESEERFRAVAESSSDAILIIDQDGTINFWNNAAKEILGYEGKEVLGKSYSMLIPERLRGKDNGMRQNYLKTGRLTNHKKPFLTIALRKDGSECPVESTLSSWEIKGQHFLSVIIRDITERKQAEKELIKTKDFLESIYNTTPDVLMVSDEKGSVLSVNKAVEKMLGFTQEELIGKHTSELFPNDKKHIQIGSNIITTLRKKGVIKSFEANWLRKDGSLCPIELNITMLQDRDGNRLGGVATIRDITERKQHEEALREREERFRTITESSLDAIITTDSSGEILYCNKSVQRIYGYTAEELMGKSIAVLESAAMRPTSRKKRGDFIKEGHSSYIGKTTEGIGVRKDGSEVAVEVSSSHWKTGDEIIFAGIVRDITQRKQMEEQLRKSHSELEKKVKQRTGELAKANKELQSSRDYLKKFAGMLLSVREEERRNISTTLHDELGAMAISVDSPMSIAKEEVKDNNRNAAIGAIEQAQAALRKAVGDLRRLAVDLRPPSLEIMGLTAALTDYFNVIKKHTTFKISFRNDLAKKKIPEDMAIVIYRVIQEALNNITRHAKANKVSVRLYPDKDKVHLDITDDGVGFDIDKVSKRRGKLKIGIQGMRERVESLGGEFSITSAPKRGTQIKATLPQ